MKRLAWTDEDGIWTMEQEEQADLRARVWRIERKEKAGGIVNVAQEITDETERRKLLERGLAGWR